MTTYYQKNAILERIDLLFILLFTLLISFQQAILNKLFQSQFSFSWPAIVGFLTKEEPFAALQQQFVNTGVIIGIFIVTELVIFIGGMSYFLYRIEKRRRRCNGKQKKEQLLYLLCQSAFFICVLFFFGQLLLTTIHFGLDVHSRISGLTNTDIARLQADFQQVLENTRLSLEFLLRDVQTLVINIKGIFTSIEETAQIPDLLNQWLISVQQSYFYLKIWAWIFFLLLAFLTLKQENILPALPKKRRASLKTDERLLQILEQQQTLLEKLAQQQEKTPDVPKQRNMEKQTEGIESEK